MNKALHTDNAPAVLSFLVRESGTPFTEVSLVLVSKVS